MPSSRFYGAFVVVSGISTGSLVCVPCDLAMRPSRETAPLSTKS
jgi:hypothetical protein